MIILLINNKNINEDNDFISENNEEMTLPLKKQEITNKLHELKDKMIAEENQKADEINKKKNEIATLEKEIKIINANIIAAEIDLLNLVFERELTAFNERNAHLESEIKLLQNTQNLLANEVKDKQNKLEEWHNKKSMLHAETHNA